MDRPVTTNDAADADKAFELLAAAGESRIVLVCDHASNRIPAHLGTLGLPMEALARHIAYDIGAGALTAALSGKLDAQAVLTRYSRLVVDANRGRDDPTLIMALSDGAIVTANHRLAPDAREARIRAYFDPYHAAIDAALDRVKARGLAPILISIHSFTPVWRGSKRPWHCGVLWNTDGRVALPLLAALRGEGDLVVGDNEPYSGALEGDCMDRHGTQRGLPHVLIEVRQDLIDDAAGVAAWSERLARVLAGLRI